MPGRVARRWSRWIGTSLCAALVAGCATRVPRVVSPAAPGSSASSSSASSFGGSIPPATSTASPPALAASSSTSTSAAASSSAAAGPLAAALQALLPLQITQTPAPADAGPPAQPTTPVFLTADRGFVAGLAAPLGGGPEPAVIEGTDNGGTTWTPVWTSTTPGLVFTFLGRSPGSTGVLYTAGTIGPGPAGGPPVFVVSTDGGQTWRVFRPALPQTPPAQVPYGVPGEKEPLAQALWPDLQFQFVSPTVGFAGLNPMYNDGSSDDRAPLVLVTRDGGQTWSPLPLPTGLAGFSGGLDFTTPTDGWITGFTGSAQPLCYRLWHTSDGGATWSTASGCLSFPLRAVDFVDATHGFAGGGNRFHGNPPFQAVLATDDGGRQWSTVYTEKRVVGRPIAQLLFTSPSSGLAVTGTVSIGGNGPVQGTVLRTTDGGRTWAQVGAGARVVAVGPYTAWSSVPWDDALMATADGGATWDVVSRVGTLSIPRVYFLHGNAQVGWLAAGPALLTTTDGGRTWTPYPPAPSLYPLGFPWFASPLVAFAEGTGDALLRTGDGGRTWSALPVASGSMGVDSVTFTNPADGWAAVGTGNAPDALLATTDGGTTWRTAGTLPVADARLAFGSQLWVATGTGLEAGVAVSIDQGAGWRTLRLPHSVSCRRPSVAGDSIWLACSRFSNTAPGGAAGIILRSSDRGLHWQASSSGILVPQSISMTGSQQGWMTAGPMNRADGLYRTTDGGTSWTRVWPNLPGPPAQAAANASTSSASGSGPSGAASSGAPG